eukprot:g3062.t1
MKECFGHEFNSKPKIIELLKDSETSWKRNCEVDIDQPLFKAIPPVLVFDNYNAFDSCKKSVLLRNLDKISRKAKIEIPDSPFLKVKRRGVGRQNESVALGMAVEYDIELIPQSDDDCRFELVVVTDRERFILPVIGIGKRVKFDTPLCIDCGTVPVRSAKSRSLILTNVGRRAGTFRLSSTGPFTIQPTRGRVLVGEFIRCDIAFNPQSIGEFHGVVFVEYDFGGKEVVKLQGMSFELDVDTIDELITLPATYITQQTQHAFAICNKSAACVRFRILTGDSNPSANSTQFVSSEDLIYFKKGIFTLHPISGVIPPFSNQSFLVEFQPEYQQEYTIHVPIEVEGRESLLRVTLTGFGIGPNPKFSTNVLDVSNMFVNMTYEHEITLINRCPIQAEYELQSSEENSALNFTPLQGCLLPEEQQKIKVLLKTKHVGPITEALNCFVKGKTEPTRVSVRGFSRAPSFTCVPEMLDYGELSLGYPVKKTAIIKNSSWIHVGFSIICKENDITVNLESRELGPEQEVMMEITLTPSRTGVYKTRVDVVMDEVDARLGSLFLTGKSLVPQFSLEDSRMQWGTVFLGHQYFKKITISNDSDFRGKFQVLKEDFEAAEISVFPQTGDITQKSTQDIEIHLTPARLGELETPLFIETVGSAQSPLQLLMECHCIGPILEISSKDDRFNAEKSWIDFGSITAEETAFELNSGDSTQISITACLDAAKRVQDSLELMIKHGVSRTIALSAHGTGSTVVCKPLESPEIHLGTLCRGFKHQTEYLLENKGSTPMTLQWEHKESLKGVSQQKNLTKEVTQVFKFTPSMLTLLPKSSEIVVLDVGTDTARAVLERHACYVVSKKNKKKPIELFCNTISATIIQPMLELSSKNIKFLWSYSKDINCTSVLKTLTIKNPTKLPTTLSVKCQEPFYCNIKEFSLQPGELKSVNVEFDAGSCNTDSQSKKFKSKLEICDSTGNEDTVDFGPVQKHTVKRSRIQLTNKSEFEVKYHWTLCHGEESNCEEHLFDIRPIRGTLLSGHCEEVVVSYFAQRDTVFNAFAFCHVEGGPIYKVPLLGSSGQIEFSVEPKELTLKTCFFGQTVRKEIIVRNQGIVPFEFNVHFDQLQYPASLRCLPMTGTLFQGEEIPLTLWANQCGFDGTMAVKISTDCVMNHVELDLPQTTDASVDQKSKLGAQISKMMSNWIQPNLNLKLDAFSKEHAKKCSALILSEYLVEFGSVIKGQRVIKEFSLTNTGDHQVSFSVGKQKLSSELLKFDPLSCRFLKPKQTIKCNLMLQANESGVVFERIPIRIKHSPSITILATATIIEPEIQLSCHSADFGEVQTGFTKVMFIQLSNPTEVISEWSVKEVDSGSDQMDVFSTNPASGVIQPGDFCNIQIHFTPWAAEIREFKTTLSFEVKSSEKKQMLSVEGTGICPEVKFDKEIVSFSPIQPHTDTTESVQLINQSPFDIIATLEGFNKPSESPSDADLLDNAACSVNGRLGVVFFGDVELAKEQAQLMSGRYELAQTTILELIQDSEEIPMSTLQGPEFEKGFILTSTTTPPEDKIPSLIEEIHQLKDSELGLDLHLIKVLLKNEESEVDDLYESLKEFSASFNELEATTSAEELHLKCIGVHFKDGQLRSSTLPLIQQDLKCIPEPYTTPAPVKTQDTLEAVGKTALFSIHDPEEDTNSSQWRLASGESQLLSVGFHSQTPGEFKDRLRFEIWNVELNARLGIVELQLEGICDVPRLSLNPYSQSGRIELGPVHVDHPLETKFQITNTGLFDVDSKLTLIADTDSPNPFSLSQEHLLLKTGDIEEITVVANPTTEGDFEAKLVVSIEGNPEDTEVHLLCIGALPKLEILSQDGWIHLGRNPIGKSMQKIFTLSNPGLLSVDWMIEEMDESLLADCSFSVTSGSLQSGSNEAITVEVCSQEELVMETTTQIKVSREDEALFDLPLILKGDWFEIKANTLPQELDFGTIYMKEIKIQTLCLSNEGTTTPFSFKVYCSKDLFLITPTSGLVQPQENLNLEVKYNVDYANEVNLKGKKIIHIELSDVESEIVSQLLHIPVYIKTTNPQFSMTPNRRIEFGVHESGRPVDLRRLLINNEGELPLTFTLSPSAQLPAEQSEEGRLLPLSKSTLYHLDVTSGLQFGPFGLDVCRGEISLSSSKEINVSFNPQGCQRYLECIFIHVSNLLEPMKLEICGESGMPTVDTLNKEFIFQNVPITHQRSYLSSMRKEYNSRENKLFFGTTLASTKETKSQSEDISLVFLNPGKLPTELKFEILPEEMKTSFSIKESNLLIPPCESGNLVIQFHPEMTGSKEATLQANIREQEELIFSCGLVGEGILPSIRIEGLDFTQKGNFVLDFGKVLIDQKQRKCILFKNEGTMDSLMKFSKGDSSVFSFSPLIQEDQFLIPQGSSQEISLFFKPLETGRFIDTIFFEIEENPFESYQVELVGEAYEDSVLFTGMSIQNQVLDLGEVPLSVEKSTSFSILNCTNKPMNFCWMDVVPGMTLMPSQGTLEGNGELPIGLTFVSESPMKLDDSSIRLQLTSFDEDDSSVSEHILKIKGQCDEIQVEISIQELVFEPTYLLDSRTSSFLIRNGGNIGFDFKWKSQTNSRHFHLHPSAGHLSSSEEIEIQVNFTPLEKTEISEVEECLISHLPNSTGVKIHLKGEVLDQICTLDLPRDQSGKFHLLEFNCPCNETSQLCAFLLTNSTESVYSFHCTPCSSKDQSKEPFKCLTDHGTVPSGGTQELKFEFFPPEQGSQISSIWNLRIVEPEFETQILLRGIQKKPSILIDPESINFGPVLLGTKARTKFQLVNKENMELSFKLIDPKPNRTTRKLLRPKRASLVEFVPFKGTLKPHSSTMIDVVFTPEEAKSLDLLTSWKIAESMFQLPVRAAVKRVRASMWLHEVQGRNHELHTSSQSPSILDFDQITVMSCSSKTLLLKNEGDTRLDFSWSSSFTRLVSVSPVSGQVESGNDVLMTVEYRPVSVPGDLKNEKIECKLSNGTVFVFGLKGTAKRPKIRLSPDHHDFGTVLVRQEGMNELESVPIKVQNRSKDQLKIQFHLGRKTQLKISTSSVLIEAMKEFILWLSFSPTKAQVLKEKLIVQVNEGYSIEFPIRGEAVPLNLQLQTRVLSFGELPVSRSSSKAFRVFNKTPIPVSLSFLPSLEAFKAVDLTLDSPVESRLNGRESMETRLCYSPTKKMSLFSIQCLVEIEGKIIELIEIKGASKAPELVLSSTFIAFGNVLEGTEEIQNVFLENQGDLETPFQWTTTNSQFQVHPKQGTIAPGQILSLRVCFTPYEASVKSQSSSAVVHCSSPDCQVSALLVEGVGVRYNVSPQTLEFACSVGETDSQTLPLDERSVELWTEVEIHLSSPNWSVQKTTDADSSEIKEIQLLFHPQRPVKEEATLTCVFPDGNGLVFNLTGVAKGGHSREELITREVTLGTKHMESIKLTNSDNSPKTYNISIEELTPAEAVYLTGKERIKIAGDQQRSYKLDFMAHVEGTFEFLVHIVDTQCIIVHKYRLKMHVTRSTEVESLKLISIVRQTTINHLKIFNPLSRELQMSLSCANHQIEVQSSVTLAPLKTCSILVKYLPFTSGRSSASIKVDSAELGSWEVPLDLHGLNPAPEPPLHFTTQLGESQTQSLVLTNYYKNQTRYNFKIQSKDSTFFTHDDGISVEGQDQFHVKVTYEPIRLSEEDLATLEVVSEQGGSYEVPLVGRSLLPKPQGPIQLEHPIHTIHFKNPFPTEEEFQISIDNPLFKTKSPLMKTGGKQVSAIQVESVREAIEGSLQRGQMVICNNRRELRWIYYLQSNQPNH